MSPSLWGAGILPPLPMLLWNEEQLLTIHTTAWFNLPTFFWEWNNPDSFRFSSWCLFPGSWFLSTDFSPTLLISNNWEIQRGTPLLYAMGARLKPPLKASSVGTASYCIVWLCLLCDLKKGKLPILMGLYFFLLKVEISVVVCLYLTLFHFPLIFSCAIFSIAQFFLTNGLFSTCFYWS